MPNAELWKQIIGEVQPKLVLTTGTAGGIGKQCEVGDVIVSSVVRFDFAELAEKSALRQCALCERKRRKRRSFHSPSALFKANASQLPSDNKRPPAITVVASTDSSASVVTTDFFGLDTTDNHFKLQGLGDASEMGDAVLGMVAQSLGVERAGPGLRSAMSQTRRLTRGLGHAHAAGPHSRDASYKAYGRCSSVRSAIVCWGSPAAAL